MDQFQLHQTLKFDNYNLKLILGKRDMEEILPSTYTGEAFLSLFDASRNTTKDQRQAELRLSSSFDGPFNFVAGASWAEEDTDMLAYATVGLLIWSRLLIRTVTTVCLDRFSTPTAPWLWKQTTLPIRLPVVRDKNGKQLRSTSILPTT